MFICVAEHAVNAISQHTPHEDGNQRCAENIIDLAKVRRVQQHLEPPNVLQWSAETLKALADPTRLTIVRALMVEERLCVCDIAALAGVSPSGVSHQLRLLRSCRLVQAERAGKMVYYRLDDEHVRRIVELVVDHAQHD